LPRGTRASLKSNAAATFTTVDNVGFCLSAVNKRRTNSGFMSTMWKTFVRHHLGEIVAMDFFTVHTVWFKPLHVLLLVTLRRRQVIHFSVTAQPTSAFVAVNLKHAFPEDAHPTWLRV